ncbi:primosomal protein N' [Acaryochloris marina]|uniref:primosomal protein N' n=1 Tax=Acaryochloris marina TaxID=155978 RepID=UPI0021C3125B|nr:primosomal protein N' [Acaryochloris marina]BDM83254.1 primosomal protein N' [Acaryochloris marina MBIC10699]
MSTPKAPPTVIPTSKGASFVEVLVDCPGTDKLFTYRIPSDLNICPGDFLNVPFGARQVGAIAMRCLSDLPPELTTTRILSVVDVVCRNLFPPGYWQILEKVAAYYHTSLMAVIRVALPPGLLQRSQRRIRLHTSINSVDVHGLGTAAQDILTLLQQSPTQDYTWQYLRRQVKKAQVGLRELQQRGLVKSYLQTQAPTQPKQQQVVTFTTLNVPDLTKRQQEILTLLNQEGGELWAQDLLRLAHTSSNTLKKLASKGCITLQQQERLRLETSPIQPDQPRMLTPDQAKVLSQLNRLQGYAEVLLHGVTGSGKTEVYLQAITPVLARQQSVIVLVPEIGLTPQLTDRFRSRFGDRIRVYHSALSDGERYDTWRQFLTSTPQVVIGTRSAIFAPVANIGLIVLDEEHDTGYKQDQPAPCYHARTVARWRAQQEDCPLILGSATPCLESWSQTRRCEPHLSQSKVHYLQLPQRVNARPMPPIEIVDMRLELANRNHSIFSRLLKKRLQELQQKHQQGLLFMPRRGHSTFVSCRSCGYVAECPHCSISMTYHHSPDSRQTLLRCHYCNYTQPQPQACPVCKSSYFRFFGSGTQRVMQELDKTFPELRVIRFDSDTTRRKGAHRQLLNQFARGQADLMVGTQMLTKGIDLPQVQLIGVLAADSLLNIPDFRASERTFQTLLQVAGRAGRGEHPGQVILQTYAPEHPVIQAVQQYSMNTFLINELKQRREANYPPFQQLILLRISGLNETMVENTALDIANYLKAYIQLHRYEGSILGPAPASILRVARRYYWHVLVKRPQAKLGQSEHWPFPRQECQQRCPQNLRLQIDVDPLKLL